MILVIGGAFQGKRKAALDISNIRESELIDGSICSFEEIYSAKGIDHFHEYIRRMLQEEVDTEGLIQKLYEKNPEILIISTELGYGIVPVEKFDRIYRERTGRILCELAATAYSVYRVVAGIPVCIKGDGSCK